MTPLLAEAEEELAYLAEVETQLLCLEGAEAEEGDGGRAMAVLREVESELAEGKYVKLSVRTMTADYVCFCCFVGVLDEFWDDFHAAAISGGGGGGGEEGGEGRQEGQGRREGREEGRGCRRG